MGWRAILVVLGALPCLLQGELLPIRTYTTADGLAADHVNCIVPDSRGFLWFCTPEGPVAVRRIPFRQLRRQRGIGAPQRIDAGRNAFRWVFCGNGARNGAHQSSRAGRPVYHLRAGARSIPKLCGGPQRVAKRQDLVCNVHGPLRMGCRERLSPQAIAPAAGSGNRQHRGGRGTAICGSARRGEFTCWERVESTQTFDYEGWFAGRLGRDVVDGLQGEIVGGASRRPGT